MAISDYLNKLVDLKKQLVTNLKGQGIAANDTEKLNTLVPKVLDIDTGTVVTINNSEYTGDILNLSSMSKFDIYNILSEKYDVSVTNGEWVGYWDSVSTLPYNFYYGSAVVYNNEIHILGSSSSYTKHYKWDGSTWTEVSTLPYNFYYGSAVVYGGCIHILGSTNSSYYRYHYKWDGSSWSSVSTLPYDFYNGYAVVYNNEIHILGSGYYDSSNSSRDYRKYHYKYNGSSWTKVSTLPYYFYGGRVVVYNDGIHILGSGYYDYYTRHYKYNGSSWTKVSTLPYKFYNGYAVVYNNEIHILGSSSTGSRYHYINTNIQFRYEQSLSTLPYIVNNGSAVVYNNEIHILGSSYYSSNNIDYRKYHYKYNGSSWTEVSTLPFNFYEGSAVVYNNEIHIFYGTNHYNWNGTSWSSVSTLPYNFYGGSAVVYGGCIHILGGNGSSSYYQYHYKWDGNTWTEVSLIRPYRYTGNGIRAVVYKNELYIFNAYDIDNKCHFLRFDGSEWIPIDTSTYCSCGVFIYNDKICMCTGSLLILYDYDPDVDNVSFDDQYNNQINKMILNKISSEKLYIKNKN